MTLRHYIEIKSKNQDGIHLPMQPKHVKLIRNHQKTSTIRGLGYNFPIGTVFMCEDENGRIFCEITDKQRISVPAGLTNEICKSEGNYTKENLVRELKSYRHLLPKPMWLYFFKMKK